MMWAMELSFAFAQSRGALDLHISDCVSRVQAGQSAPVGSCSFDSGLTGPTLKAWTARTVTSLDACSQVALDLRVDSLSRDALVGTLVAEWAPLWLSGELYWALMVLAAALTWAEPSLAEVAR